jgi:hypothetical protein
MYKDWLNQWWFIHVKYYGDMKTDIIEYYSLTENHLYYAK